MTSLKHTLYHHRFSDRLVAIVQQHNSDTKFYKTKRVDGNCPLTPSERQAYVHSGPISAVKLIRQNNPGMSLADALTKLNDARYGKGITHIQAKTRAKCSSITQ